MQRIALINNFEDYRFNQYFNKYGKDYITSFDASKNSFPDPDEFDYFVLSGSECSILENHKWIEQEMELVINLAKKRKKILGICFGHQLIAKAFIGSAGVRKTSYKEFGWYPVTKTEKSNEYFLLEGLPFQFTAFLSHFDEVCNLDERFEILATTKDCKVQAMVMKDTQIYGVQFHPEIENSVAYSFLFEMHSLDKNYPWPPNNIENYRMDFRLLPVNRIFNNFFSLP